MVRYDHPVFHNGKRVLWHGAWRGSAGRHGYARSDARERRSRPETVAAAATAAGRAAAAAAEARRRSAALKPFAIVADPGDLVASRMARDFVEVLGDQGAQGRAIVGSTAPTGVAKVMRTDMADFAIVTLDSLAVSVKYQPDWPKRVAAGRAARARNHRGRGVERREVAQRPRRQVGQLRRPRRRDRDQRTSFCSRAWA